jgi:hypothetical protein
VVRGFYGTKRRWWAVPSLACHHYHHHAACNQSRLKPVIPGSHELRMRLFSTPFGGYNEKRQSKCPQVQGIPARGRDDRETNMTAHHLSSELHHLLSPPVHASTYYRKVAGPYPALTMYSNNHRKRLAGYSPFSIFH